MGRDSRALTAERRRFLLRERSEFAPTSRMKSAKFRVDVGFQVYLSEGGEEIGAVREAADDRVVIYVEGAGDFVIMGAQVHAAHDGKLILDRTKLEPKLLEAIRHAHEKETE
jgi:hypothetical protein